MKYWQYGTQLLVFLNTVLQVLSQSGEWSKWGEWSQCSVTCGYGIQTREKVWVHAKNSRQGQANTFTYEDIMECYINIQCPVDGAWGYWGPWSECSKMCDGGTMMKYRECNSPKPSSGGKFCEGKNFVEGTCNEWECPPLPPDFDISKCNESTVMCMNRLQCIPAENKCDNTLQCHDGSDEYDCEYYYVDSKGVAVSVSIFAIVTSLALTVTKVWL